MRVDLHGLNGSDSLQKTNEKEITLKYLGRKNVSPKSLVVMVEQRKTSFRSDDSKKTSIGFFLLEVHGPSASKLFRRTSFQFNYRIRIRVALTVVVCRSDQRPRLRRRKGALIVAPTVYELGLLDCNSLQPNNNMKKRLTYVKHDVQF